MLEVSSLFQRTTYNVQTNFMSWDRANNTLLV